MYGVKHHLSNYLYNVVISIRIYIYIYIPMLLYELRDFNHINLLSFERIYFPYSEARTESAWMFECFKCMKIIQASHVIILYQGCYSYLVVYFYIDSIYESLWTTRYWYSSNCAGFERIEERSGVDVKPCLVTRLSW